MRQRCAPPSSGPLRLAYADPPYPGRAYYYRDRDDYGGEVDVATLVHELVRDYPDGWALSTSSDALRDALLAAGPEARVASWHRGERPTPHYRPLAAWEPVVYSGGRAYLSPVDARRIDALELRAHPRRSDPARVVGAKPGAFCRWVFDLLGMLPGDELVDLYPGSGGVARAWSHLSSIDAGRVPPAGVTRPSADRDASPVPSPSGTRVDVASRRGARRIASATRTGSSWDG